MPNQNNSNNNSSSNDSNDTYEGAELFEEDIIESKFYAEFAKESESDEEFLRQFGKRNRDEEDDDDEELKSKRQKKDDVNKNDESEDSVSDEEEESETEIINTKYSKRFDAIEDYKEKNILLSEMSIQDVMSKLDKGETISKQEFETLGRANRLMDQDILKDKDSIERTKLYEDFSMSVQKEISDNNETIEHHEKKISEYLARLEELNQENSETSSNNDSSDSNSTIIPNANNPSNSSGPDDPSNSSSPDDPSGSPGPDDDDDDDGFDDFPPSFDFDDF